MSKVFALTLAAVLLAVPAKAQDRQVSGEAIIPVVVSVFDQVVFGAEYAETQAQTVIAKWQGPIRISVQGKDWKRHGKNIERHARALQSLTKLDMKFVPANSAEKNLLILFVPRNQMATIPIPNASQALMNRLSQYGTCFFISARNSPDRIAGAWIVVNHELTPDRINHCLLEELTQSLGMPNDTTRVRESIFRDGQTAIELFPLDRIIIQALYDQRLQPGTPRAQALKKVEAMVRERLGRK